MLAVKLLWWKDGRREEASQEGSVCAISLKESSERACGAEWKLKESGSQFYKKTLRPKCGLLVRSW